jgi:hypothetical protein
VLLKFSQLRSVNNNSDSHRTRKMEHCIVVRDIALSTKNLNF